MRVGTGLVYLRRFDSAWFGTIRLVAQNLIGATFVGCERRASTRRCITRALGSSTLSSARAFRLPLF